MAFLEYLFQNQLSPDNYVTAIRAIYITYAVPTLSLRDERIQMFTRALKLIRPFASTIPPFITEETLRQIVQNGMIWFQSAVQNQNKFNISVPYHIWPHPHID